VRAGSTNTGVKIEEAIEILPIENNYPLNNELKNIIFHS